MSFQQVRVDAVGHADSYDLRARRALAPFLLNCDVHAPADHLQHRPPMWCIGGVTLGLIMTTGCRNGRSRSETKRATRRRRQGEAGPTNLLRSLLSYLRVSAIEPEPARSFRG